MSDYHEIRKQRDALAVQLAQIWGWPAEPYSVLQRLTGDRTMALATFSDEAYTAYLGVRLAQDAEQASA